jgi:hypothetical protein
VTVKRTFGEEILASIREQLSPVMGEKVSLKEAKSKKIPA